MRGFAFASTTEETALDRELEGAAVHVHCLYLTRVDTKLFEPEHSRDDKVLQTTAQAATLAPLREAIRELGIPTNPYPNVGELDTIKHIL
jgi:short-subunit dehydrogenase